ncbi:MAG: ATP-binding cassette domain-containing protein [Tannerella sp.]|jgi:zinc transport system ATP-binding protein|nr:ATP-binding cassette domain-containing protein [Tannerella sp.]
MEKRIEITQMTAAYDRKTVLHDVSLTVGERDFLGITGPNGGGKTTLLKVILGLMKPSAGRVCFYRGGRLVPTLGIGYLPQVNRIDRRFPISVREAVASGLMAGKRPLQRFSAADGQRIEEVLAQMGLETLAKRPVGELSGGELQRVLLGRAIVSQPEALVLDEPDTYIDKAFKQRLYALLDDFSRRAAVILVSHDRAAMQSRVKHVAHLNGTLQYYPAESYPWNENG